MARAASAGCAEMDPGTPPARADRQGAQLEEGTCAARPEAAQAQAPGSESWHVLAIPDSEPSDSDRRRPMRQSTRPVH